MSILHDLKLSFSCPSDWDSMKGDERRRFCDVCRKDVHNLSEHTAEEAEAIVSSGNACVRMEPRADGSTVVKDCPKSMEARRRALRMAGSGMMAGGALALASCASEKAREEAVLVGVVPPPKVDEQVRMMGTPQVLPKEELRPVRVGKPAMPP
jgi:hypothetical protein